MQVEWWWFLVFLVITGLWAEWRYWCGRWFGQEEGIRFAHSRANTQLVQDYINELKNTEDIATQMESASMFRLASILVRHGLIFIDEKGYIHGYKGSKVKIDTL